MSTIGAQTSGVDKDTVRILFLRKSVLNSADLTPYPNTINYHFPEAQSFKNCEIALGNLACYYSWYNITAAFGNNTFSYNWPVGTGFNNYVVTVPDGFYEINDLNAYLETQMVANGTYLINTATGAFTYFLTWAANTTYYAVTINAMPVPVNPTAAGYTQPANYPGGPSVVPTDPQLVIPATPFPAGSNTPQSYSFSKLLGFFPGTYPPNVDQNPYFINGQEVPVIESTASVNVRCSMVSTDGITTYAQILYNFVPTVPFGNQIVEKPFFPLFVKIADGFYNNFQVQLMDENYVPLNIEDPHINMTLLIRGK